MLRDYFYFKDIESFTPMWVRASFKIAAQEISQSKVTDTKPRVCSA